MRWWPLLKNLVKQRWRRLAFWTYVLLFVLLLLTVTLTAEPVFRLVEMIWNGVASQGAIASHEPALRLGLLIAGAVAGVLIMRKLVQALQSAVRSRTLQKTAGTSDRRVEAGIWIVVALLLTESMLSEILTTLFEGLPDVGAQRTRLLVVAFVGGFFVMMLLAAKTLRTVDSLAGHHFVNRLSEARQRPDAWPAKVVICALSVPPKRLIKSDELHSYESYGGDAVDTRFSLFSNPSTARFAPHAEKFVELFNWRQIVLAYDEQIKKPYTPESLPLLVLLCSHKSKEYDMDFRALFAWLLMPLQKKYPAFCPLDRLVAWDQECIEFEDLDNITSTLEEVYSKYCNEYGEENVIIDITGAPRPWVLAALKATLEKKQARRTFSYVSQSQFERDGEPHWVRYYDIEAVKYSDPAADQVGAG